MADRLKAYGKAGTFNFPLVLATDNNVYATGASIAAANVFISKDEGAFAAVTSAPTYEGKGWYSQAYTAANAQAARIAVSIPGATANWADTGLVIETYGHPSAEHPTKSEAGAFQTTINSATAQTVLGLAAGATDADAYNRWKAVIEDESLAYQVAIGHVIDYSGGASKQITLKASPLFTVATGDSVTLIPDAIVGQVATGGSGVPSNFPALDVAAGGGVSLATQHSVALATQHTTLLASGTSAGQIKLTSGGVSIATGETVTAGTVSDKTGYSLATGQTVLVASGTAAGKIPFSTGGGHEVLVDIERINRVAVTGQGATGNKWRAG